MSAMLEVRGLEVNYGHIEAVRGIDLDLQAKEITALVGANGAGKSTTLLALSGLLPKARGKILFEGEDVTNLAPHQLVARGIVQVPEGRAILTTMTVLENLELGAYRRGLKNIDSDLEYVFNLFPRLKERITGIAGNLSGGEQQMLAIGRALMAKPRLLLLDEPSMGLAPIVVQGISQVLDDYILSPLIQGKSTDMSMPLILFASIAGGVLGGFYGLLLAIPVAACLKILFEEMVLPRIKAWASGDAPDVLPIE